MLPFQFIFNHAIWLLIRIVHPIYLLSFMLLFQTCLNVCLLLNTKEDILKNVDNQVCFWSPTFFKIAAFFKAQLLASLILFFLVVDNGIRLGICEHLEKILMQLLHDCHQHISQYPGSLYTWLNKFLQLQRHCSGSILAHPEPGGFRPPTLFLIFQSRHILSIYVQ